MPEAMYETDSAVSQYCEFHYGKTYFTVPNFPSQCAAACFQYTRERPRRTALDLGCAVGRATFELAKEFDLVTGIDFSARFIRVALQLKEKGVAHFELVEEGDVVSYHEARLSELGLDGVADRVEFFQGDATNLKPQFTGYDLVLAANLIDRLNDPRRFLETIHERLNPGGVLVIASPYTWLEEFTKKENWLGGVRHGGEPYFTLDALRELLSPHFTMLDEPQNVEFVIRETRRKFQHTVSELTAWKRDVADRQRRGLHGAGTQINHDRWRGALWGMFVGDALAMPVHWYYDVAALQRDFGVVRDFQPPRDFHPSSIMPLASTGGAGRGSQRGRSGRQHHSARQEAPLGPAEPALPRWPAERGQHPEPAVRSRAAAVDEQDRTLRSGRFSERVHRLHDDSGQPSRHLRRVVSSRFLCQLRAGSCAGALRRGGEP